jgi:hypothetical protein
VVSARQVSAAAAGVGGPGNTDISIKDNKEGSQVFQVQSYNNNPFNLSPANNEEKQNLI